MKPKGNFSLISTIVNFISAKTPQATFLLFVMCFICVGSLSFPSEKPLKAAQISQEETLSNELTEVHIIGAYWQGNSLLPKLPKGKIKKIFHFVVAIKEWIDEKGVEQLYDFSARAARELTLKAKGRPDIKASITKGTVSTPKIRGFWFKINEEELSKMVSNVPYTIHIENTDAVYRWIVEDGVTLTRPEGK